MFWDKVFTGVREKNIIILFLIGLDRLGFGNCMVLGSWEVYNEGRGNRGVKVRDLEIDVCCWDKTEIMEIIFVREGVLVIEEFLVRNLGIFIFFY